MTYVFKEDSFLKDGRIKNRCGLRSVMILSSRMLRKRRMRVKSVEFYRPKSNTQRVYRDLAADHLSAYSKKKNHSLL